MDYEQYEKECKKIRKENEKLISGFRAWLLDKGLAEKTIDKHARNIDFYINVFLLYEDAFEAEEGVWQIDMFLGYWFIRKAMWSTRASIKSNATSIKKFYRYLYEKGRITKEELAGLKETIKEAMPEWLATIDRYFDPNITDMEEVWGI